MRRCPARTAAQLARDVWAVLCSQARPVSVEMQRLLDSPPRTDIDDGFALEEEDDDQTVTYAASGSRRVARARVTHGRCTGPPGAGPRIGQPPHTLQCSASARAGGVGGVMLRPTAPQAPALVRRAVG